MNRRTNLLNPQLMTRILAKYGYVELYVVDNGRPSAKREGFAVVPNTTWDDIGALSYVREELRLAVVEPIRHPDLFSSVGITAPAGPRLFLQHLYF